MASSWRPVPGRPNSRRKLGSDVPLESQARVPRNVADARREAVAHGDGGGDQHHGQSDGHGFDWPALWSSQASTLHPTTVAQMPCSRRRETDIPGSRTVGATHYWMGHQAVPARQHARHRARDEGRQCLDGVRARPFGMCGGAATGRELANMVAGRSTEIDLAAFRPDRFASWN